MLKLHKIPDGQSFFSPAVLLASFGGSGLIKPASGTWGSLAALPIGLYILLYYNWLYLFISSITLYIIGIWACTKWVRFNADNKHEGLTENADENDPSAIVIDEAVGLWLTLALIPYPSDILPATLSFMIAFFMFRLFDIAKPWPINYVDKNIKGAHGIMFDDVIAGLLAALSTTLLIKGYFYVF